MRHYQLFRQYLISHGKMHYTFNIYSIRCHKPPKIQKILIKINYKFPQIIRNPLPAYITLLKPEKNQLRSTVDFK